MRDRLKAIKERCERASPGPWNEAAVQTILILAAKGENKNTLADGTFIAHAREDIPYLLSLLDEAREGLSRVLNSQIVKDAPYAWYSEALSDARELLAKLEGRGG